MEKIILGIIQGATEFLPISSSGHLALFSSMFKINPDLPLFSFLHIATLFAILIFVHKEILEILEGLFTLNKKYYILVIKLIISTIPAGLFGILFNSKIENSFNSLKLIAFFFLLTSAALFISDNIGKDKDFFSISYLDALIIGLFQMLAIFPGISRSGFTLFGALLIGMQREKALKYSFLMSVPIILGAGILEFKNIQFNYSIFVTGLLAFIVGLISLYILKRVTIIKKLKIFGYYCLVVAIVAFFLG
ncbi:undecaprenyl-diphosphate phosphatase [Thermosipho atlanticus]|uniref:Undecaprenyl-diphosphatase n=1 Tax=Thermosipho atlanticus DSM 15807 TaxID=1123380 RepID=A0A1M5RXD4_9BACT|nr:undecaprenyl-diphosphate phosphatase [Thermosipho atlanticus]SHH30849.1 undecaprenyl-diphosphatase [Thermosipho atlanticus DSM 15807]